MCNDCKDKGILPFIDFFPGVGAPVETMREYGLNFLNYRVCSCYLGEKFMPAAHKYHTVVFDPISQTGKVVTKPVPKMEELGFFNQREEAKRRTMFVRTVFGLEK